MEPLIYLELAEKLADVADYALKNGREADARDLYWQALEYLDEFQLHAIAGGGAPSWRGALEESDRLNDEWTKRREECVLINNARIKTDQKALDAL